jgi:DNA-binding transcriptional ArsR family regulator
MSNRDLEAARLLRAMAHPARLRLLNALRREEECVCHLTALLHRPQAYISQQLMFLRQAGLVQDRKDSFRVYYRIKEARVLQLLDAMNLVGGAGDTSPEKPTLANCACPKCQTHGRAGGQAGSRNASVKSQRKEYQSRRDSC